MHLFDFRLRALRRRSVATLGLFSLGLLAVFMIVGSAGAAATTVPLGTTASFSILAGAGITNTGPTTISGDIGTFPTTSISGPGTLTVGGTNHAGDAVTQQAQVDLVTAYNAAAGEGPTLPISADLGGQTLTAGVYNSASSISLNGALTLDGAGDPNAVFVFQAGSTLTTGSASSVNLINDAQSCNVFWQIGSTVQLGTTTNFRGTLIASSDIALLTGATVDGRVLSENGAVTLDSNTITNPTCAPPPAPPAPPPPATTTTAATTTVATTTAATTTAPAPTVTTATSREKSTTPKTLTSKALAARVRAAKILAAKNLAAKNLAAKNLAAKNLAAKNLAAKRLAAKNLAAKKRAAGVLAATHTLATAKPNPPLLPFGFTG